MPHRATSKNDDPRRWNELGRGIAGLGHYQAALAAYDRALAIRSDVPQILSNRGNALRALGRLAEAEASLREALQLAPDFANAHSNLGTVLIRLDRFAEAEASLRQAIRLQPEVAEFHKNLGYLYMRLARPVDAQASYRAALRLRPDDAEIHEDFGMALLWSGRFEEGWAEYEWRWQTKRMAGEARRFSTPPWRGQSLVDKVILLHAEQGLGDTLQFCRYVSHVAAQTTILEVQPQLFRLLSRLRGFDKIITRGDPLPPHDLHCSLLSLPHALGTTLDTIPGSTPYLSADPRDVARWRGRLSGISGLRVGLCWAGGKSPNNPEQNLANDRRSLRLDRVAPLAGIDRISFVSLQKGPPADEAVHPPMGMKLYDFTAELQDFADTAALIECLDLVISVDTSVAHLTGALGKPVWLLTCFGACFRWLQDREDSPWYPSLRQFRQPALGDWETVLIRVREALLTARVIAPK